MGIEFNGSGSQVVNISNVNLANGWSEYTVCSWIKSNVINSDNGWFQLNNPDGRDRFGGVRFDEAGIDGNVSNNMKFGLEISNTEYIVESAGNVQTTNLMFIAGRWRSGSPLEIIINGEVSIPAAQETGTGTITSQPDIHIGRGCKNENDTFDGIIYDHRVYNAWLTDEELQTMYLLPGKDTIFRNLELWYKFVDGYPGMSPSLISDWSHNDNSISNISGSPLNVDLSETFIRRR